MDEIELKPCPFCGSEAFIKRSYGNDYSWIMCSNYECHIDGPHKPTVKSAIKAWNKRTNI